MSTPPESNAHHPEHGSNGGPPDSEDLDRLDFEALSEELAIVENAFVLSSYPYSHFEAALNGEMTPREWAKDLAHHVDTQLLPD
jgi:hypothetical protein